MQSSEIKIGILGGGAWGCAIAHTISENGFTPMVWCLEQEVVDEINIKHSNSVYLPNAILNKNIFATHDLLFFVKTCNFIFISVPVTYLRNTLEKIFQYNIDLTFICWINLSKGIEQKTFLLPSQIITTYIKNQKKIISISGPGFAREIIKKQFTGLMISGKSKPDVFSVQKILNNNFFKTFYTNDLIGIEVGGALKNICTLLQGILKAKGYGINVLAYVFTKCLNETTLLAEFLGGKRETIYGLAGLGDLFLSSSCEQSKNFRAGLFLGKEERITNLDKIFKIFPEGINTVQAVYQFICQNNLKLPLLKEIYKIIFEEGSIEDLFK